ncbi:glycosyltransferase [Arenimonas sp.]|uniref:glycosyltransferase n=1 Tax=Arenimonas sp. TaxID=1872635 RepID=UPI002E34AFB3|nr:glycosyltransferase [Arenimonas sp.]HEX4854986.1 glycosyltransferase [Arenimonas sp.]
MNERRPGTVETLLRGLYLLLPFGWDARLRIKRALFRALGPLLAGSDAHRRWREDEARRAAEAALAQSEAAIAGLTSRPLQRRARRPGAPAGADDAPAPSGYGRRHGLSIVLVVHDAHPHGAQYLALNLLAELVQGLGLSVRVVLLGPGPLEAAFRELAPVDRLDAGDAEAVQRLAASLHAAGHRAALANSLVSGRIVRALAEAGLRVVTLAHEMPGLVLAQGLEQALQDVVAHSARVVVPAPEVAEGLRRFADPAAVDARCVMRPQGLYVVSPNYGGRGRGMAARRLRERLSLAADTRIVLAVGYADARKGVDLFAEVIERLAARDPRVHGVWVGHQDAAQRAAAMARLERAGLAGHLHFAGLDFDTDDFYAGADAYALTSREDPFPSVLLEALSVGTPAVAFAGTGGGAGLLARIGSATVPGFDTAAFADAIAALLQDPALHAHQAARGIAVVEQEFCFRRYAMDLLDLAGVAIPRVSVVVPNYNYAGYLRARLASIAGQDLPVYEIIVLDDASTDGSAESLRDLRAGITPVPRLHLASVNGRSVFRQWANGVAMAHGDYVWIAEADDLSTPAFLETLVTPMQQDASIVMAYCQSRPIDSEGRVLAPDYADWTRDLSPTRWTARYVATGGEEARAGLGLRNTIPNVSAVVFRREVLAKVLGEHLGEIVALTTAGDWVTYLQVLQHGRILFDPTPCNLHRRHRDSVVAGQDAQAHAREVEAARALARRLHGLDAPATNQELIKGF